MIRQRQHYWLMIITRLVESAYVLEMLLDRKQIQYIPLLTVVFLVTALDHCVATLSQQVLPNCTQYDKKGKSMLVVTVNTGDYES